MQRQVEDEIAIKQTNEDSAGKLLDLSLSYYQTERYRECIKAAQKALDLHPDYAEAYNNIAAGYMKLSEWDHERARGAQNRTGLSACQE